MKFKDLSLTFPLSLMKSWKVPKRNYRIDKMCRIIIVIFVLCFGGSLIDDCCGQSVIPLGHQEDNEQFWEKIICFANVYSASDDWQDSQQQQQKKKNELGV